ncbi:hypothetical protein IJU97_01950 [bacterium]|nr:hypothetical protein [bacterium]
MAHHGNILIEDQANQREFNQEIEELLIQRATPFSRNEVTPDDAKITLFFASEVFQTHHTITDASAPDFTIFFSHHTTNEVVSFCKFLFHVHPITDDISQVIVFICTTPVPFTLPINNTGLFFQAFTNPPF